MTRPILARLRPLALALALVLPATASAQDQPAAEGTSEGNPVPGYVATGMLALRAIFVLCKSARRAGPRPSGESSADDADGRQMEEKNRLKSLLHQPSASSVANSSSSFWIA